MNEEFNMESSDASFGVGGIMYHTPYFTFKPTPDTLEQLKRVREELTNINMKEAQKALMFSKKMLESLNHSKPVSCKVDTYLIERISEVCKEYKENFLKAKRKLDRTVVYMEKYGVNSKKLYAYVIGCSAGNNNKSLVDDLKDFTIEVTEKDCIRKEGEVASVHQPVNPYFKKEHRLQPLLLPRAVNHEVIQLIAFNQEGC